MTRILLSHAFNQTPGLCGGTVTPDFFNFEFGYGWTRNEYGPRGVNFDGGQPYWEGRLGAAWCAGFPSKQWQDAFDFGMAGTDRNTSTHMALLSMPLVGDSFGYWTGDIESYDFFFELEVKGLTPEEWPRGGSGQHQRFRNSCAMGLVLFGPLPTDAQIFFPCYRIYWVRFSDDHPTKPGAQEIYAEDMNVDGSGDPYIAPDIRGALITGQSGRLHVLDDSGPIPELGLEDQITFRVRFYRPQAFDGLGMQIFVNDVLIGASTPRVMGEMGFKRGSMENRGWISPGEKPENALKRHFGIMGWTNCSTIQYRHKGYIGVSGRGAKDRYQTGVDAFFIRDIAEEVQRPPIFPKPTLVTEPELATISLSGEGASDSDPELPIQPEHIWSPEERIEVEEFQYDTGHFDAVPLQSTSRPIVQFDFVIEDASALSSFKTFVSNATALGTDGRFQHAGRYWRIVGHPSVTHIGGDVYQGMLQAEEIFNA